MATAVVVQDAPVRRWSETDYENKLVAIACFTIDGGGAASDEAEERWIIPGARSQRGFGGGGLAVFPGRLSWPSFRN